MNDNTLITIAIPTYKRYELLCDTINSIACQLNDYFVEVIVLDNDADSKIVNPIVDFIYNLNDPRITYHKNGKNLGMVGNWNQCLSMARGKWFTIMHDDDIFLPDYMHFMMKAIRNVQNIQCIAFLPKYSNELSKSKQKEAIFYKPTIELMLYSNFHMSGVMIDVETAKKLNGFNHSFHPIADYEFNLRLLTNYNVLLVKNKPLVEIRIIENASMNRSIFDTWFEKLYIIRSRSIKKSLIPSYIYEKLIKASVWLDVMYAIRYWLNDKDTKAFLYQHRIYRSNIFWTYSFKMTNYIYKIKVHFSSKRLSRLIG